MESTRLCCTNNICISILPMRQQDFFLCHPYSRTYVTFRDCPCDVDWFDVISDEKPPQHQIILPLDDRASQTIDFFILSVIYHLTSEEAVKFLVVVWCKLEIWDSMHDHGWKINKAFQDLEKFHKEAGPEFPKRHGSGNIQRLYHGCHMACSSGILN